MEVLLVPAVLLLVLGGVVHAVDAGARSGQLARNRSVGVRTRGTLSSDAAWSAGHRAAAPWLRAARLVAYVGAAACGAAALGALAVDASPDGALAGLLPALAVVAVVALLLVGGRVADRAARAEPRGGGA